MKPPEYLGPYRIGALLGKGGMGSVYQAKHAKSGQEVAVKLIATQISDEMRFRQRFDAEIDSLELLRHPNIVKLLGFGEELDLLFYSMELVRGETLQTRIRRQKKLPWDEVLDFSTQVASALKHAHDIGVIHRDLKPANLMINEDGQVKLLDFGISKLFGNQLTAAGSIMGTADYMSPEQANEEGVTVRTDLFALGAVMYGMLCGKSPFRGKNITMVMDAVRNQDPIPLDMIDPTIPDEVVELVHQLLQKNPEDRPPTALVVMNRLKATRSGLQKVKLEEEEEERLTRAETGKTGGSAFDSDRVDTTAVSPPQTSSDKTGDSSRPTPPARKDQEGEEISTSQTERKARDQKDRIDNGTVSTDGHNHQKSTEVGTESGSNRGDAQKVVSSVTEIADVQRERDSERADGDTSESIGKTHFQTVSDGDVRRRRMGGESEKGEHPLWQMVSILLIVLLLIMGGIFLAQSMRGPTADELLVAIENPPEDRQSFQIQDDMERFLKLFPDHPKAADIRQQQQAYRVEAAIRRLKLKAKLRVADPPIDEQTFLEAMAMRQEDPEGAREKLLQWLAVFQSEQSGQAREKGEGERAELAELAKFESERLAALRDQANGTAADPRLAELMKRIESAVELPKSERDKLLRGIITLYEGQAWADKARAKAIDLLGVGGA